MTKEEKQDALQLCRLYGPNNCWTGGTGRMASLLLKALRTIDSDAPTAKKWGPLDRLYLKIKK